MVKQSFLLWCTILLSFLLFSCKDDENPIGEAIEIDEQYVNITLDAEETTASVKFTATSAWKASFKEEASNDWIALSKKNGVGGPMVLDLTLKVNTSGVARVATLVLSCGNSTKEISVSQGANSVQIMDEADVEDLDRYYKPQEFANMDMLRSDSKWSWFRSRQSEHFFVFWEAGFGDDPNAETVPEHMRVDIDDLLNKAERYYQTNIEKLKLAELGKGKSYLDKYKMEIYLLYQEEWLATGSGYDNKIGALWVNPSTCQPVGSTIAHEIGHSFQYQVYCDKLCQGETDDLKSGFRYGYAGSNGGNGFWEQCAQWQSFQDYPEEMFTSYNFDVWLNNNHRHFEHEWMRYASYWLQTYWTAKHGVEAVGNVWKKSVYPDDAILTYMKLYCGNDWSQMKNELYDYASRMATFDIEGMKAYSDGYLNRYHTTLYQNGEYYQVAYANCPGTTGFNVIPLNVPEANTVVEADFVGLNPGDALSPLDPGDYMEAEAVKGKVRTYNAVGNAADAGWMCGFVALFENGERKYAEAVSTKNGKVKFAVPAGTKNLYFIVLGAPAKYKSNPWDEKELTDEQWPYKVKFTHTDLLGNVELDMDTSPQNIELTYNVSIKADAQSYDGTQVSLVDNGDIVKLAKAFVMQPSAISAAILSPKTEPEPNGIAFAAVKSDNTFDYNTTANGWGFWFDSKGQPIGWGADNDSRVFIEFAADTFLFTIGQYPGKCKVGDTYQVKEALIYMKGGTQYIARLTFNITIK